MNKEIKKVVLQIRPGVDAYPIDEEGKVQIYAEYETWLTIKEVKQLIEFLQEQVKSTE